MSYLYSYYDNSDEFKHIGLTALIGLGVILFYVFVFMNFRLPYLIERDFLSEVGFGAFFNDEDGLSTAFKVTLGLAIGGGGLVALIGFFTGNESLIGGGIAGATVGILGVRLAIAILGYVIWLIFSQIMIIAFMIATLGFMIYFAKELSGRKAITGAVFFMLFIMFVCVILCIIGFRLAAGDTMEDVLVWVIRLFV